MAATPKSRRDEGRESVDIRTPPHSLEAEQAVLGGLLLDASAWFNVSDVVQVEDFYRPDHRTIFDAIRALASNQKVTDAVTVAEHLEMGARLNTEWDGEVSDKQKFLADIKDPHFKPTIATIQDVKMNFFGDTAVVTGTYHAAGTYQGKPYDHFGRFTDTWIFDTGQWQCVASHTSLIKK